MASISFLYSSAFMAKSRAQTVTFNSVRDRLVRESDKKTQRFWPPRWQVKSDPHQAWHGDGGPQARCWTSQTFGVRCIVSPPGALKIWGNPTPST